MRQRTGAIAGALLLVLGLLLIAGCAGTGGGGISSDPRLINNELEEIETDIAIAEEMLKGSRAQLQIEDSTELRSQIRTLEMDLYELRARKAALGERLKELEAEGGS